MGLSTNGYEAGAKKIESIEKRIRNQQKANNFEAVNEAKELNELYKESIKADNDLYEAEKRLKKMRESDASGTIIAKQLKYVEKLTTARDKLQKQYQKERKALIFNAQKRKNHIDLLKMEAAEIKKASGLTAFAQKSIRGLGSGLVASLGGALTVGAFKGVINNLDELAKRARDVRISASSLQALQHEADKAGISTGELDMSIRTFNKNVSLAAMGTGEARAALSSMGISLKDANGKTKTQGMLLKEVSTYFAENANEAENAGRAARLFGDRGSEMLRIFEGGGDVIKRVFEAKGIDEAAAAAERFNNTLSDLSQSIMPSIYNLTGSIAKGWLNIVDFISTDLREGIGTAELKRQQEELNKVVARERAERERAEKKAQETRVKNLAKISELNERLAESRDRDVDKVLNLKDEIAIVDLELLKLEEGSEEYLKIYSKRIDKIIELEKVERKIADKKAQADKKKADEQSKAQKKAEAEAKRTQKKAEAEAKRAKEQAEELKRKRDEYDLNLQIAKLEKGDDKQKAQAEAMRNSIERNRLMKEYGFSIAEATARLKEQKQVEEGGKKTQYSDKDIAKAKKIVERGKKGSVGKKTLEQAQAILDGKEIDGKSVSMFASAQKGAKKKDLNFAPDSVMSKYGAATTQALTPQATPTAITQGLTPQPIKNAQQGTQGEKPPQNEKLETLLSNIESRLTLLEDIKTSITQYFNGQTRKATV